MRRGSASLSYVLIALVITFTGIVTIVAMVWAERRSQAVAGTIGAAWLMLVGTWAAARGRASARMKQYPSRLRHLGKNGRLPRVRDIDDPIRVGVHPAMPTPSGMDRSPPYIPREVDLKLDYALRACHGFILLVGDSTAGKTRAAFEAMRRNLSDFIMVQPDNYIAIDQAVEQALRESSAVIFLDDLERFLGYETGLTISMVDRLFVDSRRKMVLLATMRRQEHIRYNMNEDDGRQPLDVLRAGREVLARTKPIYMDRIWSSLDQSSARLWGGDDPRIIQALTKSGSFGVSEWLAAGPMLSTAWEDAWEAHPRAAAIIAAAVDARRAGFHRPLTGVLLRDLHDYYLGEQGGELLSPEPFDEALAWATTPRIGKVSLLLSSPEGYVAFDYLVDQVTKRLRRVPDRIWNILLDHSSSDDAVVIGQVAYGWQLLSTAERAFRRAVEAGIPNAEEMLALCLRDAGRLTQAADMFAQLVVDREQRLGPNHHDTMLTLHYHARTLGEAGRPQEAASVMAELVERSHKVLSADDRDALLIRHDRACYLARGGRPQEGARLLETVLSDRIRVLGADDPDTLSVRNNYACYVGETGQYEEAVRLLDEVRRDRLRVLGPDHPRTMNTRRHHARFLGRSGDPDGAADLLAELTRDSTRLLGPNHPDTLFSRRDQARFIGDAGDRHRAADLLRQLVQDSIRAVGDDHPDLVLAVRRYHAINVAASGDPDAAVELLERLQQDSVRVCGEDNVDTLLVRRDHARLLADNGDGDRAMTLTEQLADDCERVLGADHPDTQGVTASLNALRNSS